MHSQMMLEMPQMSLEPYNFQPNDGTHYPSHYATEEWLQPSWRICRRACLCRRLDIRAKNPEGPRARLDIAGRLASRTGLNSIQGNMPLYIYTAKDERAYLLSSTYSPLLNGGPRTFRSSDWLSSSTICDKGLKGKFETKHDK